MALRDSTASLHNVVIYAIDDARARGQDDWRQYQCAFRAVMRLEPDLTTQAASRLVNAVLEAQDKPCPANYFVSTQDRHGAATPLSGT